MTYSISVQGHGDEPYEEREATEQRLLGGIVNALEAEGGNVTTFSFQGNEVRASTWEEARRIAAEASDGEPA
jgi:hypothetical protein